MGVEHPEGVGCPAAGGRQIAGAHGLSLGVRESSAGAGEAISGSRGPACKG